MGEELDTLLCVLYESWFCHLVRSIVRLEPYFCMYRAEVRQQKEIPIATQPVNTTETEGIEKKHSIQ